ncbi:MAG: hypothetical protein KTR30_05815 [Saprospiraceae bacterium]|nr:hypothetical protein [Saprospiraceae bacterium]
MKNVSFVLTFLFFALFSTNIQANTDVLTPISSIVLDQGQSANVFVHISAIKKTAKGLTAQIDGFSIPKGNPGKDILSARLEIQGDRLLIQLNPKGPKVAQLTMPAGYQVPEAIAKQLGATQSVVMSGGSTMTKQQVKSMLWFEIQ